MKLQVMSDLHLEMHADKGAGFLRELDPAGVDVLVLAGDVTMARHYEALDQTFAPLSEKYADIVYVPGNHEYYRSSSTQVTHNLARLGVSFPRVHVLQNRTAVIGGQRFFGGSMWFPHDPAAASSKPFMNDFALIEGFEPWVYEDNERFKRAANREVSRDVVVVSHHLPAPGSIAAPYAGSALNAFFLCDMTPLIELREPKLWIHGHTHHRCDYKIGETRIVANPLGYPNEAGSQMAFDPALLIEV
jgi:predicted phosphodiesterase